MLRVAGSLATGRVRPHAAAVEQPRALPAEHREHRVLDEDVARLSPLRRADLHVLGR